MALEPCRTCGAMISSAAVACPKCLAPRGTEAPSPSERIVDALQDNPNEDNFPRVVGAFLAIGALIALVLGIANYGASQQPRQISATSTAPATSEAGRSKWTTAEIDQKTAEIEAAALRARRKVEFLNAGTLNNAQMLAIAANDGPLTEFQRTSRNGIRLIGDLSKVFSAQSGMLLMDTPEYSFWGYISQDENNLSASGRYLAPSCEFIGDFSEHINFTNFTGAIRGSGDGRDLTAFGEVIPYRRTAAGFLTPELGLPVGRGTADLRFVGRLEYSDGDVYVGDILIPEGDCLRVMRDGLGALYSSGVWQKGEFNKDRLVRLALPF